MEISPSGLGLKIWCCGQLPAAIKKALDDGWRFEMYDRARYFTVMGTTMWDVIALLIKDIEKECSLLGQRGAQARTLHIPIRIKFMDRSLDEPICQFLTERETARFLRVSVQLLR